MKSFMLFVLCGLAASTFAAPSCSDDEASKCDKLGPSGVHYDLDKSWPGTPEELDYFCPGFLKVLQCSIDFGGRCPNTLTAFLMDSDKECQRVYQKICSVSDPLRQKFLETVPCLNKEVPEIKRHCEATITGLEYCELSEAVGKCIKDGVAKKCGSEAHRIFINLYKPKEAMFEIFCRVNPEDN